MKMSKKKWAAIYILAAHLLENDNEDRIDHELPTDMENYMEYKIMGSVQQIRMKPGCLPSKFECQLDQNKSTSTTSTPRSTVVKRQKVTSIRGSESVLKGTKTVETTDIKLNDNSLARGKAITKTSTERGREYRKRLQTQKSAKVPKSSTQRTREWRARISNKIVTSQSLVSTNASHTLPASVENASTTSQSTVDKTHPSAALQQITNNQEVIEIRSTSKGRMEKNQVPQTEAAEEKLSANTTIKMEPRSEERPQICADAMADIRNEEICLKTEPDDEYFRIDYDESGTDPFECGDNKNLKQDLGTNTGKKLYECDQCKEAFSQKKYLKTHLRTHVVKNMHECDHCGKLFRHKSILKKHLWTHTGEKPYGSNRCGEAFSQNLTDHLKSHSDEKPYECNRCGTDDRLTAHEYEKEFYQKSSLRYHLRTQTGERPYKCNRCGRAFTRKLTLTHHLTTHAGGESYKCNLCGMVFGLKSILLDHLRMHNSNKSYELDQNGPNSRLSENILTINDPLGTKWKYADCTETVNNKPEEILLIKTEPSDEYFQTDLDETETDPLAERVMI